MLPLKFTAELTPKYLADLSKCGHGFYSPNQEQVLFYSTYRPMPWQGAPVARRLRILQRLSLYSTGIGQRLSVFDGVQFPINDIAFHPHKPLIAVGAGMYDGGYLFEGELWLWNWETDYAISALTESRQVLRVRFMEDNRLSAVLSPPDEGDFSRNASAISEGIIIDHIDEIMSPKTPHPKFLCGQSMTNLGELTESALKDLGFTEPPIVDSDRAFSIDGVLRVSALGKSQSGNLQAGNPYERRDSISEIHWLSDSRIAVIQNQQVLELWTSHGDCEKTISLPGAGVQMLPMPDNSLLIYVLQSSGSALYRLVAHQLEKIRTFDKTLVFSTDRFGNLLGRNAAGGKAPDCWLSHGLREVSIGNLGHYDCFNHHLRLNGGNGLYFLQGAPTDSYQQKQLCRLYLDGTVQPVMQWDNHKTHLMNSMACWMSEEILIRAFEVYDGSLNPRKFIECWNVTLGERLWHQPASASVTAMAAVGKTSLVYGLADGTFGLRSLQDGRILYQEVLALGGVKAVVMALATRGENIAMGTLDGRLWLLQAATDNGQVQSIGCMGKLTPKKVFSRLARAVQSIANQ